MDNQAIPDSSQPVTPPPPSGQGPAAAEPPKQYYLAQPVKRKRSFFSGCLIFLLLLFLGGAMGLLALAIFGQSCLSAMDELSRENSAFNAAFKKSDFRVSRKVITPAENDDPFQIAVIKIQGVIQNSSNRALRGAEIIATELRHACQDRNVIAIILDLDTPGGEVVASDEILHQVLACREAGKPVIACMRSLAASGGYFIAAGSDWIIANRMTLTGSIGVIIGSYQINTLLDKIGVQAETYRSGSMKDMLSPTRERSPQERDYVQEMVNRIYLEFCQVVANGREQYPSAAAVAESSFGDGRILSGADALAAGLVDQLGYLSDAIDKAKELCGNPDAAVVSYAYTPGFMDFFFSLKESDNLRISSLLASSVFVPEPGKLYYLYPNSIP